LIIKKFAANLAYLSTSVSNRYLTLIEPVGAYSETEVDSR